MVASTPTRYHPFYVVLHWLMALLVIFSLVMGTFFLSPMPNTAEKVGPLSIHAMTGILIAILLVIRLVTRFALPRPAQANQNNTLLRFVANAVHLLLYVGMLGMVISGLGLSSQANLAAVFRGEIPIPADFMAFLPRMGHGFTSKILLALVGIHVAAALYHQLLVKDNLLGRMWFGRK